MPQNIDIRKALSSDIAVLEMLKPIMENGYFRRCLEDQDAGKRDIFVAFQERRGVGYGILNWSPRYTLYKRLDIPEIQDLNVLPEVRRQGVATALVRYCEDIARDKRCEQIGISVGLYKDYGPAQRLYAKLGYIPDGFGVTYDRQPVAPCEMRPVDDNLCLMLIKDL